jgi:hypothetical protein
MKEKGVGRDHSKRLEAALDRLLKKSFWLSFRSRPVGD